MKLNPFKNLTRDPNKVDDYPPTSGMRPHATSGAWVSGPWPSDPHAPILDNGHVAVHLDLGAAPMAEEPQFALPEWESELLEREARARATIDVPLYRVPMLEDLRADEVLKDSSVGGSSLSLGDFLHPWFHGDDECQWEPAGACPIRARALQVASTMLDLFPGLQNTEQIELRIRMGAYQAWWASAEQARKAVGSVASSLLMLEDSMVLELVRSIYREVEAVREMNPHRTVGFFTDGAKCRVCGCTDDVACSPPCSWAEADLCTGCQPLEVVR